MRIQEKTSLTNHLEDLRSWFCNRGYPESTVEEQLRRVENRTRGELLRTNNCVGKKVGVRLIVAYYLHLHGLHKIMLKNLKHLQADLLYHSVQPITSKVIQRNLSFTLCNVQLVSTNLIFLDVRLAEMQRNDFLCCISGIFSFAHSSNPAIYPATSVNYDGKGRKNVGLTSKCHLSNTMPDSIFINRWRQGIT